MRWPASGLIFLRAPNERAPGVLGLTTTCRVERMREDALNVWFGVLGWVGGWRMYVCVCIYFFT